MSSFGIAVEQTKDAFAAEASARGEDAPLERVTDPARLREAAAVAACAERLADFEIEPPSHGKGVGRGLSIAIVPPLRNLIDDKKLGRLDQAGSDELRQSILAPLAWGYLGLASVGGVEWDGKPIEPRLDLDPAETWIAWASQMFGGLGSGDDPSEAGVGPLAGVRAIDGDFDRALRAVQRSAMEQFTAILGGLGLMPKRLKRMRLKLVGQKYVESGALLRLVQGAEPDEGDSAIARKFVEGSWPFEKPPIEGAP